MWAEWSFRMLQVLVFRRRNEPRFWFLLSKWQHSYFSAIWYSCASDSKTQPPYWAREVGLLADSFPLSNPCSTGLSTSAPIHTLLKQRLPWWAICRVTNGSLELWRRIWALYIKRALGLPNYNQDSPATPLPPLHVGGKGVLLIVLRATALGGDGWRGDRKAVQTQCPFFSTFRTAVMRKSVQGLLCVCSHTHLKSNTRWSCLPRKERLVPVFKIKLKFIEMWINLRGKGDTILKKENRNVA